MKEESQSYFEFIQSIYAHNFAMHDIMHEFFIDSKSDNINHFLNYFEDIKRYQLDKDNKDLLYFIMNCNCRPHHINNNHLYFSYKEKHELFSSSLWFVAFEKNPTLLIDVLVYFDEQINEYVKSNAFLEKAYEEIVNDIVESQGVSKIRLLTEFKGLFLPYQQPKLHDWSVKYEEKQQLEAVVMNNSKITPLKHKIKL